MFSRIYLRKKKKNSILGEVLFSSVNSRTIKALLIWGCREKPAGSHSTTETCIIIPDHLFTQAGSNIDHQLFVMKRI